MWTEIPIRRVHLLSSIVLGLLPSCNLPTEYLPREEEEKYSISLFFKPVDNQHAPFIFGDAYQINGVRSRIDRISFYIEDGHSEITDQLVFDEISLRQRKTYYPFDPDQTSFELVLKEDYRYCYEVSTGSAQDGTTETVCDSRDLGIFEMELLLDLDRNGSFETTHDISVDLAPLTLARTFPFLPIDQEIAFLLHIPKLFSGIDMKEINRLSNRIRIAENLISSLELD